MNYLVINSLPEFFLFLLKFDLKIFKSLRKCSHSFKLCSSKQLLLPMSHALWKTLLDPATPTNYEIHFVNKDTHQLYVTVKCHREVMLASSKVMRQTQKFGTHMFNRVISVPQRDMDAALQVVQYMYTRDVRQLSPTHLETIKRLMALLGLSGYRQVANLIHVDSYRQLTPVNSLAHDLLTNSVQTADIQIVLMVQRYSYVTVPMHRAVVCASSNRLRTTLRSHSGRQVPVELGEHRLVEPCAHLLRFMYTHDPQLLKAYDKSAVMRVAHALQLSPPLMNILNRVLAGHRVTTQCANFEHKVMASTTDRIPTCAYYPDFWHRVQGVDHNAKRFISESKLSFAPVNFGPTHTPPVSLIRPAFTKSMPPPKCRNSDEITSPQPLISAVFNPPVNFGPTHTPPVSLIRPKCQTQRSLISAVSNPASNCSLENLVRDGLEISSEFRHSDPPRTKKRKSLTDCRPSDDIKKQPFRPTKRVTRSQTRALRQTSKRNVDKTPVKRVVTRSQNRKKTTKTPTKRVAPSRRSARIRNARLQNDRKRCKR